MVPKRSELASNFACHVFGVDDAIVGAIVAAAAAAASAAQQRAQAAAQKRASQNAAQAGKQGMAVSGQASSVASNMLGSLNTPDMQGRLKSLISPATGSTTPSIAGQAAQGLPNLEMGQSFQEAVGQTPDYLKMIQGGQ